MKLRLEEHTSWQNVFSKIFCTGGWIKTNLETVVNLPQAENSKLYNVLKIARFATKGE